MDEASQIRPEDALGAVARAKQIVVVGDTKQMPPSNYWSRTLNEDDDEDVEEEQIIGRGVAQDAESILECAKNAFLPRSVSFGTTAASTRALSGFKLRIL